MYKDRLYFNPYYLFFTGLKKPELCSEFYRVTHIDFLAFFFDFFPLA